MTDFPYYTAREVAALLGVHAKSVVRIVKPAGRIGTANAYDKKFVDELAKVYVNRQREVNDGSSD